MTLDIATILTIFGGVFGFILTLIVGAVWVMGLVNKITTRVVSQEKDLSSLNDRVENLLRAVKEHESKNSYFRHNFDPVTKSIFNKIDDLEETIKSSFQDGFTNIKELFNEKLKHLNDKINEKK